MRQSVWPFYLLSVACLGLFGASYSSSGTAPMSLRSPQGKVEFTFVPFPERSVDPDIAASNAGLRSIRYEVTFYQPGSHTLIQETDFYDNQISKNQPFPTPMADLAAAMMWSPKEDFTVLPLENWPPEKKTNVRRKAVAVNLDFPWQTKDFLLENSPLVWTTPLIVVGNSRDGCKLAVTEFNARTGKTTPLSEASLPAGYAIVSSSEQSIVMKKVLSSCATAEDAKTFIPECSILDLRFNRKQIGACPP